MAFTLKDRADIAQSVVDRFLTKTFRWGSADCAQLTAHALDLWGRQHPLTSARKYHSELGGLRIMRKCGFHDLEAWIDSYGFERIPPVSCLPGDILSIPTGNPADPWNTLSVAIGNGRCVTFVQHSEESQPFCDFGNVNVASVAWRVTPIAGAA